MGAASSSSKGARRVDRLPGTPFFQTYRPFLPPHVMTEAESSDTENEIESSMDSLSPSFREEKPSVRAATRPLSPRKNHFPEVLIVSRTLPLSFPFRPFDVSCPLFNLNFGNYDLSLLPHLLSLPLFPPHSFSRYILGSSRDTML